MSRYREKPEGRNQAAKIRESFYKLAVDWVDLHLRLPQPARTDRQTRRANREYGHPAEWASDKSAQIADLFWSWHDMLAEHRNERRPAEKTRELIRVVNSWKYLEPRFEQLCELVEEEALREIIDLHHGIQRTLGRGNVVQQLDVPCQNPDCGRWGTMQRHVKVGNDLIICGRCGYTVREDHYPLLVRMVLDDALRRAELTESA